MVEQEHQMHITGTATSYAGGGGGGAKVHAEQVWWSRWWRYWSTNSAGNAGTAIQVVEVVVQQGLQVQLCRWSRWFRYRDRKSTFRSGVIFGTTPGGAVSQAPDGGQVATFTASGCLSILDSGCGASANYLIVAGGGAGGTIRGYGGGGAGGYRTSGLASPLQGRLTLAPGTYPVTLVLVEQVRKSSKWSGKW